MCQNSRKRQKKTSLFLVPRKDDAAEQLKRLLRLGSGGRHWQEKRQPSQSKNGERKLSAATQPEAACSRPATDGQSKRGQKHVLVRRSGNPKKKSRNGLCLAAYLCGVYASPKNTSRRTRKNDLCVVRAKHRHQATTFSLLFSFCFFPFGAVAAAVAAATLARNILSSLTKLEKKSNASMALGSSPKYTTVSRST